MRTTQQQKDLMLLYPLMKCYHRDEFNIRLQWLSEGMLKNHMESIRHYSIDKNEIAIYNDYMLSITSNGSV